jgi:hypothetical protein
MLMATLRMLKQASDVLEMACTIVGAMSTGSGMILRGCSLAIGGISFSQSNRFYLWKSPF